MRLNLRAHHLAHLKRVGIPEPPQHLEFDIDELRAAEKPWCHRFSGEALEMKALAHIAWQQHHSAKRAEPAPHNLTPHVKRLERWALLAIALLAVLCLLSATAHCQFSKIKTVTISDGTNTFFSASPFKMSFTGCTVTPAGNTATIACAGGAGGTGTVTSVSDLAPLFTTATRTTTPAFSLTAAAAHAILGNNTAGSAAPTYFVPACASLSDAGGFCNGTAYGNLTGVPSTFAPTAHNLLSASHGDTTAAAAVRGDGLFAIGATPTWQRLAHPSVTGGYFKWNGTDVVASTLAAAGTGTPTACTNQFVTGLTLNADAAPTSTCASAAQASVTNGYVDLSSNQTAAGNKTLSGLTTLANVNSRVMCDQSTGATFDLKVNACIATVIAQGGGIADATGLTGAQTGTVEIDVGTATTSGVTGNSISVTLLLSPFLVYTSSLNTAGACAIKVFNESRLIGTLAGITHSAIIKSGTSVSTGSLICDNFGAGTGQYVAIQGVQAYNPSSNSSTYTNGLVFIKNAFDTSSISDMMIANEGGIGLHVQATCCGTVFRNIITDGNNTAGSIPLQIDSLIGDLQPVLSTVFVGLSADHPGATKNNIVINNTNTSTAIPCVVAFSGTLYMEGNSTDTTTPLMLDNGCTLVEIEQVTAQLRAASSTAHAISIAQPAGVVPILHLGMGQWQNSGLTLPAAFLDDNYRGATVVTDNQGVVSGYNGGQALTLFQQIQLYGYINFVETSAPSAIAARDLCYGDSTAHALECSYNNGAFSKVPLTGIANTFTPLQTFTAGIATGSSPPACTAGTAGFWCATEGTAPTNVASTSAIYADSTTHEYMAKTNGASGAGMMVRSQPGAIHVTGQTATKTIYTLCAASAGACNTAGQYRIAWYFNQGGTACSSVTAGSVTFALTWTDNAGAHSAVALPMNDQLSTTATSTLFHFTTSNTTAWASGEFNIWSTGAAAIQITNTYVACTTGTGTWELAATAERLQ